MKMKLLLHLPHPLACSADTYIPLFFEQGHPVAMAASSEVGDGCAGLSEDVRVGGADQRQEGGHAPHCDKAVLG